jgi:hypothetical protein
MYKPSAEEQEALLALDYKAASEALENEDAAALALATKYILEYSEKVGEELKQGRDYLALLTPKEHTPAIERIAMEIVLESVEEELDSEEA